MADRELTPTQVIGALTAGLGLLGTIAFGVTRIAYERFYDQFGITPEDVGINGPRVLAQTGTGLATYAIMIGLPVLVAVFIARKVARRAKLRYRHIALWSFTAVSLGFLTLLVALAARASQAADCAARVDGDSVHGLRLNVPGFHVTLVSVRANRALVRWNDSAQAHGLQNGKVVYLGTGESTAVVYDPAKKQTLRVPAGDVVISSGTTAPSYHFWEDCGPTK